MSRHVGIVLPALVFLYGCGPFLGQTRDPVYYGQGPGPMRLPPLVAYQDSTGPLAYRAGVPSAGVVREVHGESCQSAITLPVGLVWAAVKSGNTALAPAFLSGGWGEGGYAAAVSKALAEAPDARLVGVRADLGTTIILGIWRRQCVRVTALAMPAH